MNVKQMQQHVLQLWEANDISMVTVFNAKDVGGSYWLREVWIQSVTSARRYAVALHEIGHILGRHQLSEVVLVRERWAWEWAKRNALEWTPAMQRHADWCLKYYGRTPLARCSNKLETQTAA
jgi:hypothetical protein